jgi:hypothetical protein
MRQGGEEQVGLGQDVRVGAGEHAAVEAGVAGQLRMHLGHRRPGAAAGRHRADLEGRMTGQQTQ